MKKLTTLVISLIVGLNNIYAAVEYDITKGIDFTGITNFSYSLLNQLVDNGKISATNKGAVIRFNGGGGTRWPSVTDNPRYTNFLWLDLNTSPGALKQYTCCGDVYTNWVISTVTPGSITTVEIKDYTILAIDMATNSVPDYAIIASSVSGNKIADNGIIAGKLAGSAVIRGNIAFGAIQGGDITNKTITYTNIADNTIGPDQLANDAINTLQITNLSITTSKIALTNITRDLIRNDAIGTDQLTNGAVTADKLASNTITTNTLSTNVVGGLIKAWAFCDSNGALLKSFNIASVVNTVAGRYTLTFAAGYAPATTNYVVSGTAIDSAGAMYVVSVSTNATTHVSISTRTDSSVANRAFGIQILDF